MNIQIIIYFVFLYQFGYTPIHEAVFHDNVQMVRVLINAGVKANVPDKVMICTNVYNNENIYCLCTTHTIYYLSKLTM